MVQVHVRRLQVGRRERDPLAQRGLEVRHVPRDPRLDPVGVALAQLLGPGAVARVELAGRVALHVPGQLLELDPEQPRAVGRTRGVHRQRLADDDRRLGREQAPLGLVHRAGDAVEPGREVHDRRLPEPLVALPARRLGEREVDLHLGAAVAEAPAALGGRPADHAVEQPSVQLRRRHVRDHRARRADLLAAGEPHACRAALAHEHALDVAPGLAGAAVILDQPHERVHEPRAAAARDRHAALLDREADHLRHEPGGGRVGPEPGVQHPRREQPVRPLGRERLGQPVAAGGEHVAGELDRPRRPSLRWARTASRRPSADQSSVPSTPNARSAFGRTTPRRPATPGPAPRRWPRSSGAGSRPRRPGRASPSGARCSGTRARARRARRRAPRAPRRRPRADARR